MTFTISRDGKNLGTYSDDGLSRQLDNGTLLSTDLVFLEKQNAWVPISALTAGPDAERAALLDYEQRFDVATPRVFVAPALLAVNVIVFLAMLATGVSPFDPKTVDLIRWGADFGPLTVGGQWWRLLTAAFIHIGVLHIAFNMWALLSGGMFTERLFGNARFFALYILSAIGGNLLSIAIQPRTVAAGASGAIFGVYGGLIALLSVQHRSLPKSEVNAQTVSALSFVGYNLLYSLGAANIDISAHIGGMVTGALIGWAMVWNVDISGGGNAWRRISIVTAAVLVLFMATGWRLHHRDENSAGSYSAELNGQRVTVGVNDQVVYYSGITATEATRLGNTLRAIRFLQGKGGMVLYGRDQGHPVVSLFVRDEALQDPKTSDQFSIVGRLIATVTGAPLKLRLLSKNRELKREFTIEQTLGRR